jgi:hypothetical protein
MSTSEHKTQTGFLLQDSCRVEDDDEPPAVERDYEEIVSSWCWYDREGAEWLAGRQKVWLPRRRNSGMKGKFCSGWDTTKDGCFFIFF